ncbi:MAG TPA: hypothetical protein DCQ73_10300, partial [Spirochaetaceae bacterium]|nr:hypothetical protein [Spirochaetaceae bacterium]
MAANLEQQKQTTEDLRQLVLQLRQALEQRDAIILKHEQTIQQTNHTLGILQQILFGRKSKRVTPRDANQGLLFNEAEADAASSAESEATGQVVEKVVKRSKIKQSGRRRPAGQLERVEVLHDLSDEDCACPWCNARRPKIGEERSEEIEVIPAKVIVKVHVRAKYGPCSCDDFIGHDEKSIITAPGPTRIAPGSLFSNNTAAFIIVNKYSDGLPFNRQEAAMERYNRFLW